MEHTTPLPKQIDHLLKIFQNHQSFLDENGIKKKMGETDMIIESSILLMLIEKLHRDGYIYKDDTQPNKYYCISYEGAQFEGYIKNAITENARACRKNIRDWVLSYGTALAGIAGLGLLAWQIYTTTCPK
jgi:hypothetical protein